MKKIIFLLLCCKVLASAMGCGDTTPPPSESLPTTVITETPTKTTSPTTAVEPTEKEKETASILDQGSGN